MLAAQRFLSVAPGRSGLGSVHHEADPSPTAFFFRSLRRPGPFSVLGESLGPVALFSPFKVSKENTLTTSELEIASTQELARNSLAELAKWQLHKQHRLCRSFELPSQNQAFSFAADLCGLTVQHQQQASLRVREKRVFFEVEVEVNGISEEQLGFIRSIDTLEQAAT